MMTFARLVLAYVAHGVTAAVLAASGHAEPWQAAIRWWTVYGSLIDAGCLVLLAMLTRREGRSIRDLVGFDRTRLGRDLLIALGLLLGLGLVGFVGGMGTSLLLYGNPHHAPPMGGLPTWAMVYSIAIWPLLWGFTEETTYNGYVLPRLRALSGHSWMAVAIVSFGWAAQHIALPAMFDGRFMLYRFLSSLPIALLAATFYLRTGRLVPLIVAHAAIDILAPASVMFAPPHS
ncbi:CPBP family intramembrane metalloprotease [Archangium violaceum]|uniref:CPBP family intramembrane glutamic endopeptidase n=1 Tax=Archangium violaceum TaxID=83451 RepID=UPI00193BE61F|nr:CPBP family intramembrane glutamic endopeptidase [Archangium violaceum]QRK05759.1 CPBP family intramembrane metalloprotease [Archangium violaceum]